jgi:hypothetical protein
MAKREVKKVTILRQSIISHYTPEDIEKLLLKDAMDHFNLTSEQRSKCKHTIRCSNSYNTIVSISLEEEEKET